MNCSIAFWRGNTLTAMKSSFFLRGKYVVLFVTVFLLLLSARSTALAGSAVWNSSSSTTWNSNLNWFPTTGYPGTSTGNTATFNNFSGVELLFVSASPPFSIAGITFTALETHALGINLNPSVFLTISGTGITNNSVNTQNFVNNGIGGSSGGIIFTNSATAGSLTRFTNVGGSGGTGSGLIIFANTSTAGSGGFNNNGGTGNAAVGGHTTFLGSANPRSGVFFNSPGTLSGAFGGGTDFLTSSSADNGTFTNNGANVMGAFAGATRFFNNATADNGVFMNNGATVSTPNAGSAGYTTFADFSTAGNATFTNNGGAVSGAPGGRTEFSEFSDAGSATLIANGNIGAGGTIRFRDDSTGGTASVDVRNN